MKSRISLAHKIRRQLKIVLICDVHHFLRPQNLVYIEYIEVQPRYYNINYFQL